MPKITVVTEPQITLVMLLAVGPWAWFLATVGDRMVVNCS